uniref:Uncharacterized protein n=1 Tax=uncultured marine virus TaxID=186617 RepID=A0A0F7LBJ6_9VIRU|nr:hypothetical protein [uncultured marine virus]
MLHYKRLRQQQSHFLMLTVVVSIMVKQLQLSLQTELQKLILPEQLTTMLITNLMLMVALMTKHPH